MFINTFLTANLAESGPLTWDMAKQIIQSQSNLAMYGLTVLVGVAVVLIAGTWIWNIALRKHELEKAIESLKSEMLCESKKDFARLKKEVTDEANKIRQATEKNISSQLTLLEAEKARLFALVHEQSNWWVIAAGWWAEAIVKSAECKNDFLLRNGVNGLSVDLEECKKKKIPLPEQQIGSITQCLSYIPELLENEKKEIEDKLKKLSS